MRILTFILLFVIAAPAMAQEGVSSFDDIVGLFIKATRWLYTIFFIVATMYILFAAYTYLTAGGDATKVEKATKMIKNAVIAIVVALLASGVALIINNFLTP